MRFLHTGDWHVGRTIRGRSRMDEFTDALATVTDVAIDQKVDAVLLAGDIYDQRVVSPEADHLVFETLIGLSEKRIPVVAIPGNHDSEARLAAFAPLLERVGTHVVPRVAPPDKGGVVVVESRAGSQIASVSCLPFVSPRRFADAAGLFESTAKGYVDFEEGMGKVLRSYEKAFKTEHVNVVMGHLFVTGAQQSGSEREITVGADYAVAPQYLPATASYVALGHIHKPQQVRGSAPAARYCGSLLQLDFGERGQRKSLPVVEVVPGKPPKVEEVPVTAGKRLLDVEGTIDELERRPSDEHDAYLRVTLQVERAVPGIADRVRAALPNAIDVRLALPEREDQEAPGTSLRGLDPRRQFIAYYESAHSAEPPEEILVAFDQVYEEVTG